MEQCDLLHNYIVGTLGHFRVLKFFSLVETPIKDPGGRFCPKLHN